MNEERIKNLEERLAAAPEVSQERAELMTALAWEIWTLDLPEAEKLSRDALALAEKHGYDRAKALANRNIGMLFGNITDVTDSMRHLNDAMRWFVDNDDISGQADIHLGLGFRYWGLGEFQKGLEHANRALELYEKIDITDGRGWALTALGGFYHDWKDHDRSLRYYERAIEVFEQIGNPAGVARALNGLGNAAFLAGNHEEALRYQEQSLEAGRAPGNELTATKALNDIGLIFQDLEEYDKALEYHQKSLETRSRLGYTIGQATCLLDIGHVYVMQRRYDEARQSLDQALLIAQDLGSKPKICRAHELLSYLFRDLGQPDVALVHFENFFRIREEIYHEDADTRFKNMQAVYQLEAAERDAEIYRLKNVELKETLSQLKNAQAQLLQSGKMAALGKLVAGLTHEVNNPVGAIRSAADVNRRVVDKLEQYIKNSNGSADVEVVRVVDALRANIDVSSDGAGRIEKILNSLQTFSRLDESPFQKADIHEGINSTLTLIGPELDTGVEVVMEFGEVESCYHYPGELNQVFMNLLLNAVRAMDGKGRITIRTWRADGFINISFTDTGKGIPEKDLKDLFDPGFTTRESRVRMRTGLYASYNIVHRHHGDIHVDSTPGQGTTFTITFPGNLEELESGRVSSGK
jgi:signal transduction histidine kinase